MPRMRVVDQAWVGGRRHQRRNTADSPASDDAAVSRRFTRPSLASARSGSVCGHPSHIAQANAFRASTARAALPRVASAALSAGAALFEPTPPSHPPSSLPPPSHTPCTRRTHTRAAATPPPRLAPTRRSRRRFFCRRERPLALSPPQQHNCRIHSDKRRCASRHSLSNAIPNPNPSTLILQP